MVGWALLLAGVIALQRLAELQLAAGNRKRLLAQGGREYSSDHYPLLVVLHTGWLLCWPAEVWLGERVPDTIWPLWLALFGAAQILRYWCIVSLGPYWNTRILILPGAMPIRRGPYRYIPHPNYLAVVLELACVPLLFGAWLTAAAFSLLNAWLLLAVRIPAENEALRQLMEEG